MGHERRLGRVAAALRLATQTHRAAEELQPTAGRGGHVARRLARARAAELEADRRAVRVARRGQR
eukprot:5211844-Prymnesium_polylepis.1